MGEHELLTQLKGFGRTFVVHSNTNPYAAAAAMGQMAARSQAAGAYFRPLESFVPLIDGLAAELSNSSDDPNQITTDFKRDWLAYLRDTGLPACGLRYKESRTPEDNTMRFLNAHNRRIPEPKPRIVHESRELSVPVEYRQDYQKLLELMRNGEDIKSYLSRDLLKKGRPDKNDGLLNSWGIQHLHFREGGTDQLLFCLIADSEIFMLQVLPHNAEHLWVDTKLIQILHDNWPEQIAHCKQALLSPEEISSDKRASLRGLNANFLVTVADRTVYLPPGGGTMSSGDSPDDLTNCDKIFGELQYWQNYISETAVTIRTALHLPASRQITVRMAFDNRICCFYEATLGVRLGGFTLLEDLDGA